MTDSGGGHHLTTVPIFLNRFRDIINKLGEAAAGTPETQLASSGPNELFYIPFEHVNSAARLVIVGITPGPDQISLAYRTVSSKIKVGLPDGKSSSKPKSMERLADLREALPHPAILAPTGLQRLSHPDGE
jgi:hypothetical protein